MAWLYLLGAGLSEIVWATTMKFSNGWTHPWWSTVTIFAMIVSFQLLSMALQTLPMSTAYAIWVGIGAVGVAIVGFTFLGESVSVLKVLFLGLIVTGIVGLKLVSAQ